MNKAILENLSILEKYYFNINDRWRRLAYSRAISAIKNYRGDITKLESSDLIPNIGKAIKRKIDEFIKTGKIKKVESIKLECPKFLVLEKFNKIWGIGPKKAQKLYSLGYRTIEELQNSTKKSNKLLTGQQQIGLKYYKDLQKKIPRNNILVIEVIIRAILNKEFGKKKYRLEIAGSYRRGAMYSGDIDCLITSTNFDLSKLVSILQEWRIITDILSAKSNKFMGVANCPDRGFPYFRLDIEFVKSDEWITSLLYFTGSQNNNITMRSKAKRLGYKLNEYGLFKRGVKINVSTEKDVYKLLGMKYLKPSER